MERTYLTIFEKGNESFGAFAPDITGCFAVGETLTETRDHFLEAANAHLAWLARDHDPIPEPVSTSFDFARDPDADANYYVVEWLPIPIPAEAGYALSA